MLQRVRSCERSPTGIHSFAFLAWSIGACSARMRACLPACLPACVCACEGDTQLIAHLSNHHLLPHRGPYGAGIFHTYAAGSSRVLGADRLALPQLRWLLSAAQIDAALGAPPPVAAFQTLTNRDERRGRTLLGGAHAAGNAFFKGEVAEMLGRRAKLEVEAIVSEKGQSWFTAFVMRMLR